MPRLAESTTRSGICERSVVERARSCAESDDKYASSPATAVARKTPSRSACTCAAVTPGLSRPTTYSHQNVGRVMSDCGALSPALNSGSSASGSDTSGGSATGCSTPVNSGGSTPTIVTGTLLTVASAPTALGSPPNRVIQYLWLMTATGGAVGRSSSRV